MNKNQISENIKKYRLEKEWSQEELAEKVFSTKSTISKWESGDITPSVEILKIIAKSLGVSVYDLMGEEQPKKNKVFNWFQKLMTYALVWIHVEITFLFTWFAIAVGFVIMGGCLLIAPIAISILNSVFDAWNTAHIVYTITSIIWGPGCGILFLFLGYWMIKFITKGYNWSLKYFWQSKFRFKEININIKDKYLKISLAIVIIGLATLGIFLGVLAGQGNLNELNY